MTFTTDGFEVTLAKRGITENWDRGFLRKARGEILDGRASLGSISSFLDRGDPKSRKIAPLMDQLKDITDQLADLQ